MKRETPGSFPLSIFRPGKKWMGLISLNENEKEIEIGKNLYIKKLMVLKKQYDEIAAWFRVEK